MDLVSEAVEQPVDLVSGEDFLEADDTVYDIVDLSDIPGYEGKSMRVRNLSGIERDQYDQSVTVQHGGGKVSVNMVNARAKMTAMACVDAEGKRLFTDAQALRLGGKNSLVLSRIFDAAAKLSGMAAESEDEAVEVFGQGLDGGPSSESPQSSEAPLASF